MRRNTWEQPACPTLRETLLAFALVALIAAADQLTRIPDPEAMVCGSDMDCMRLCPSFDPECDGGPEPAEAPTPPRVSRF